MSLDGDIAQILIHRERIQQRVGEMAGEIAALYSTERHALTLVPILSGSIIFVADLIRELPLKMKIAVMHLSSYRGAATQPGELQTIVEIVGSLRDRDVLIVDDILDTGNTLRRVQRIVAEQRPASQRTAVLLRKPGKAPADVPVDFVGFDVEDQFVVGYGLDYADHYRNYPHIGVLRAELLP